MLPTTPISRSKTAALSRILDVVPRGYQRYTCGTVSATKAKYLANKFHALYSISASPAQRLVRKRRGLANTILVLYWPEGVEKVHWLLLATEGTGLESEQLRNVTDKPRLQWLDYELVRHATRGRTSWTWRRPKAAMADWYALLGEQLKRHNTGAVADILNAIARQPGFHGVREQSWALCQFARQYGYRDELPFLYYVQKVSHGEPLLLDLVS